MRRRPTSTLFPYTTLFRSAGRIMGGRIVFEGRDVAAMTVSELRAMRGRRIAMVYQDPMASLNPVMTVGRQLMEVDRKSTRLNSSHRTISYAVFRLKKKKAY